MNYQEAINKIKAIFDAQAPTMPGMENPATTELPEYILQDGTKIVVDKLAIGGTVTLNGAPAPDGSHQLQDGTVIETVSGKITEITTPAEEIGDESVNTNMGMVPQPGPNTDVTLAPTVKAKLEAIDNTLAEHAAKHKMAEETMAKQSEGIKQMMALVEKMATAPVDGPIAPVKNQYTTQNAEAKEDRFSAIVDAINKLKK